MRVECKSSFAHRDQPITGGTVGCKPGVMLSGGRELVMDVMQVERVDDVLHRRGQLFPNLNIAESRPRSRHHITTIKGSFTPKCGFIG